ncbi:MAG: 1,2-phenylacetyl-CoA epoxidase subunit PaaD [Maritimibacter sp.]
MTVALADIWAVLDGVADPEIPVISLVDLGVIRDLEWEGETLNVTVTPTYSGCPATAVINLDITAALRQAGFDNIHLKQQLAPPWSTDWISKAGLAKLEAYGIAPPNPGGTPVRCPRCESQNLTRISQFGSTPCKAQWRCDDCLEPFDYFKCI